MMIIMTTEMIQVKREKSRKIEVYLLHTLGSGITCIGYWLASQVGKMALIMETAEISGKVKTPHSFPFKYSNK